MAMSLILPVVEQHAEEAAFLWSTRDLAVGAPHYSLADLVHLDDRLDAHLDGLRVAGDAGLELALASLAAGDASEVFVAAVLALERSDGGPLQAVLDRGAGDLALARGLISAIGWSAWDVAAPVVAQLLAAEAPALRRIGLAGAAVHRHDPGDALSSALASDDPALRARACQAVGELGRRDLTAGLRAAMTHDDAQVRFESAFAAALVGERTAARALGVIAVDQGPCAERACALGIRLFDETTAMAAFGELTGDADLARLAVKAAGASAYPAMVDWLLDRMADPALARAAGEAFTMITGLDLEAEDVEADAPEGFSSGPTDDPSDEDVSPDPDEYLPWPDVAAVRAWWSTYRGEFHAGARYLLGNPIAPDWLDEVLRTGRQHHRHAAAVELALGSPGATLYEIRAPGPRQRSRR
jgi:uncharacterized protein (TIGR02270 family)